MRTLIKRGTIVTAVDRYDGDVLIEDEKIALIGRSIDVAADTVVDAAGKYVLPGGVDVHTHLDMPFGGTNSIDDFESGTVAAAHGGTTCIVDFAIQRRAAGESAAQAIHDASLDRFRPILMTTLAAVFGALPIALGFGADGASRRPLGLVIVGGLVVSQFITLYVTPAIYLYMESFQERVLDRTAFFHSVRHRHGEKLSDEETTPHDR